MLRVDDRGAAAAEGEFDEGWTCHRVDDVGAVEDPTQPPHRRCGRTWSTPWHGPAEDSNVSQPEVAPSVVQFRVDEMDDDHLVILAQRRGVVGHEAPSARMNVGGKPGRDDADLHAVILTAGLSAFG